MNDDEKREDRKSIPEVLDTIERAGAGESVTLGDMMDSVGAKAFGPLLVIPGIISFLPIPGTGFLAGALAILISLQIAIARGRIWLPGFLKERSVSREKLEKFMDRIEPWGQRLGKVIDPRLTFLTEPPFVFLVAFVALAMGGLMFVLTPFFYAVAVPGLVLIIVGLAQTVGDGIVLFVGYAAAVGTAMLAAWLIL